MVLDLPEDDENGKPVLCSRIQKQGRRACKEFLIQWEGTDEVDATC